MQRYKVHFYAACDIYTPWDNSEGDAASWIDKFIAGDELCNICRVTPPPSPPKCRPGRKTSAYSVEKADNNTLCDNKTLTGDPGQLSIAEVTPSYYVLQCDACLESVVRTRTNKQKQVKTVNAKKGLAWYISSESKVKLPQTFLSRPLKIQSGLQASKPWLWERETMRKR